MRSLGGREFALALATGTVLYDGDILYVGQDFYVIVQAAVEDVLVVPLTDASLAALAAYELGNRHLPVSIGHDQLATPYDQLVEALLGKAGIRCFREKGPFEPARTSTSPWMMRNDMLTALQMGDSFFPSGAFAHSSGLETFVADGLVRSREGLVSFIESYLVGLVARCDLIFVKVAYLPAVKDEAGEIVRLDRLVHAMKLPKELRGASIQMGRQVLQVMRDLYPSVLLHSLWQSLEARELRAHHPVIFGAACGSMGMAMKNVLLTYLYSLASALVSAGVRLIPIGHSDGQRAISELKPLMARMVGAAEMLDEADISAFAPALEVRAMQHERLSTRLFQVIGAVYEKACKNRGWRPGRLGKDGAHRKAVPGAVAGVLYMPSSRTTSTRRKTRSFSYGPAFCRRSGSGG